MRVKLKTILADGTRTASPGDVITVSDQEGKDLVDGGYATEVAAAPIEGDAETAADPAAAARETATGKRAAA